MTERLYYADPFTTECNARVVSCQPDKDGFAVTLDRTVFYPEGGGQPADHGTLGGASVTDVRDREGEVIHLTDKALDVGAEVHCAIDAARRFDFMQQHSGEHIVSGIICARYKCDNVGFHVGRDTVTIDFNADITEEDLKAIEAQANAYLWADYPIVITHPSAGELETLEYRSKKALTGDVRIVTFPGADCCACCGTHVQSSGQVGLVKLLSVQKFREGVRIEMLAGGRALNYLSATMEQNRAVSQLLSAKPMETSAAVERLQAQVYALQGRVNTLEKAEFSRKADEYAGRGDVLLLEGPLSGDALRELCIAVLEKCGGRCAVFAGTDGDYKYAVGIPKGEIRPLTAELNRALSGRGGGKGSFAQGSAPCTAAQIREFFAGR